jgi:hypothetical protein
VVTSTVQLPARYPTGVLTLQVAGGENMFYLASRYLNDATQWWRIAQLNGFLGQPWDFIVSAANVRTFPSLLIPPINPNATIP